MNRFFIFGLFFCLVSNYVCASKDPEIVAEYCIFQESVDIDTLKKDTLKIIDLCDESLFPRKKVTELKLLRFIKPIQAPKLSKGQLLSCGWGKSTNVTIHIEKNNPIKYYTSAMFYKKLDNSKRLDLRDHFEDIYPWEIYPVSDYPSICEFHKINFLYNNTDSLNIDSLIGKNILVEYEKKAVICSDKSINNFISGSYYIKILRKCRQTDSFVKKPDYSFIDALDDSEIYNIECLSKLDSVSSVALQKADSLFGAILNEVKNFKDNKCPIVTIPEILFYSLKESERVNIVKHIQGLQMRLGIRDTIYEQHYACDMSQMIINVRMGEGDKAADSVVKFLDKYNVKRDHLMCIPIEAASACSIHLSSQKSNSDEYTFFFNKTLYRLAKLPTGTYVLRKVK
jgi:hypothetical protein